MAYVFTQSGISDIASGAPAGLVGIGTPSPSKVVHVYSVSTNQLRLQSSLSTFDFTEYSAGNSRINANAGDLELMTDAGYPILVQNSSGTTHLKIDSTGQITVGTNYPDRALCVEGQTIVECVDAWNGDSEGTLVLKNTALSACVPTLLLKNIQDDATVGCMLEMTSKQSGGGEAPTLMIIGETGAKIYGREGLRFAAGSPSTIAMVLTDNSSGNGAVGIGTTTPASSTILDLSSVNMALLLPRVSSASISSPQPGMIIYDTSTIPNKPRGFTASWVDL